MRSGVVVAGRLAHGAAVRDVLDVEDPEAWLALDHGVRADEWYFPPDVTPRWERSGGGRALTTALRGSEPLDAPLLVLALCHRDGRIREKALGEAAGHPVVLPLVVVRCADWVGPVRDRARSQLAEDIDTKTAAALAPLALRIGRRHRGEFAVDLIGDVLRRAPRERLRPLFAHADRAVRRFAYGIAVEERHLSPAELARAAWRDEDTVVRSRCAEAALAAMSPEAHDDVLEPLLTARDPRARSAAVTALRRAGRPERAKPFLADRSALVRACARYVVRQAGGDPSAWYRERCAEAGDPALPPAAVIGLAESGERVDAELLWPLTAHPVAAVRARAVAGLRALEVTDVPRLTALLDDPAPGVVREATSALAPSARVLDAEWLMPRLGSGRPRHVRVSAFRLLNAHQGLVRLRAAVVLLDDPDDKVRHWAQQSVQRWRPTADVPPGTAEVGELLDRGRHLFSEYVLARRKWEAGLKA
ncbi:hypothetical protein [Streptomyces lincolnensis]|uniref:hypothetical protein n=1 Tax=Streptomyces lincolnensis TaxID=1915 RepID=UPI0037CCCF56